MALIESEIYNRFAKDLDLGLDVVDRESYEIIIDSRRKEITRNWLQGKRGIILDFGCGDGTFSRFFKNILNPDVVGLDISAGMIEYASKIGKNINYLIADCHNLPFKRGIFDFVTGFGIFHHLNLRKSINECMRSLRMNGSLITFEHNYLCPISFLGRKLFKTKIHTPNERPLLLNSFLNEIKNGFKINSILFISPIGFIFPFLLASNFNYLFGFSRKYSNTLKTFDQILEKIPVIKFLSWQFLIVATK